MSADPPAPRSGRGKSVVRAAVYLSASLAPAALVGLGGWLAWAWHWNTAENVASFRRFREAWALAAVGFCVLGALPLATALVGLMRGVRLRWWDFLVAGAAVLFGAGGILLMAVVAAWN